MSKPVCAFAILILTVSLSIFVGMVIADNANFVVQPLKDHVINLSLKETDSFSASFSVISDDDTGITFYIIDPQNMTVLRFDNVKQKSFSFIAEGTGNYQLRFDNSVSASYEKTVALNYNVIHYIMGMPQEQFYFLLIAAVALIGVMTYVILMPK